MRKKIVLLASLMIALIALAQTPFPVAAYVKEPRVLQPISGSNVDAGTFYWGSHIIADGFAVTAEMDLPVEVKTSTQTRFGFAVGLGYQWDEWVPGPIGYYHYRYTPYVDNMWLTIQGDADYSVASLGSISDNTGTGEPSAIFETIISALSALFTAYDIANFVPLAYEEPPREEWDRNEHWATAIVRQKTEIVPGPRLQTACASLMSYFQAHKWNTLSITAEAEICIEIQLYNWWTSRFYIGTYSRSFEVKVASDEPPETPYKPSGPTSGYVGSSYTYSSDAVDPENDNICYQFDWGDGSTPTTTGWYTSGSTASASHTWGSSGTYDVNVRAQDLYGEWSNWSPSLPVSISKLYYLTISSGPGGTTEPPSGTYPYSYGYSVPVTATANSGYAFDYWLLDGVECGSDPTITVTMDSDHTLKASFCMRKVIVYLEIYYQGEWWGDVMPQDNPKAYYFVSGSSPYNRYTWSINYELYGGYWWGYLSGGTYDFCFITDITYDLVVYDVTIPEQDDYSMGEVKLQLDPYPNDPNGGGCPTLFVWDGSQYVEEATLDIHADSDMTLQHTIEQTLVPDKNSYKLSLRELDNFTSHVDQVKLYAVDSDGEMYEAHLTNATHSELGDVKEFLLHDDETRVDMTPEQTIDLKFTVPNIDDDVACFTFEINGYNQKTPGGDV